MEVTSSSSPLHTVDFWKTAADATYFANNSGGRLSSVWHDHRRRRELREREDDRELLPLHHRDHPAHDQPARDHALHDQSVPNDPVSLSHPTGKVTGLALRNGQLSGVNVNLTAGEHVTASVATP